MSRMTTTGNDRGRMHLDISGRPDLGTILSDSAGELGPEWNPGFVMEDNDIADGFR